MSFGDDIRVGSKPTSERTAELDMYRIQNNELRDSNLNVRTTKGENRTESERRALLENAIDI